MIDIINEDKLRSKAEEYIRNHLITANDIYCSLDEMKYHGARMGKTKLEVKFTVKSSDEFNGSIVQQRRSVIYVGV